MKNKVILDLCGGSGAWSKPYENAGFDVRNITLPHFNVLNTYPFNGFITDSLRSISKMSHLHFSGPNRSFNIDTNEVFGILAAPPCTNFSLARQNAKTPRNFNQGMRIVQACLQIIWICRANGDNNLKFWALENPMGYLRQFLGKPSYTFQPYEFSDNSKKRTDLWGYFKNPEKNPISKPTYPRKGAGSWQGRRSAQRAITPPGFAQAFFEANTHRL